MPKARPLIKCLTDCEKGQELTVLSINAGAKAKKRLADLGLVPNSRIIKSRAAPWNGPLAISVKGTSLVIGRGIANKIMVQCKKSCID